MKMLRSIPALPVENIKSAAAFYSSRMGFSVRHQEEGFAILERDSVEIHLWASADRSWQQRSSFASEPIESGAESFLAGTASCRVEVTGIDALYEEYKKQEVIYSPRTVVERQPWGTREFPALDLHRNLITFFERVR